MSQRYLLPIIATLALASATSVARATELTGVVVDHEHAPIAGVLIEVSAAREHARTLTDQEGRFTAALPGAFAGEATVTASALGFRTVTVHVADPTVEVELVLEPLRVFSGEIDVTGPRARSGETPVTFSNVGREEIERLSWGQDVPLVLDHVPGFYAYNDSGNGIGYSYFFLRGFDMRRTAVTINGVPLNDAHSHSVFFIDLADFLATTGDIQVQRGVGTTLYGGSAIGGSVDLRTRAPLTERRLRVSTMTGSWDTSRWSLEYDSGLIDDRWASTFRWSRVDSEGYRDQSWVSMWNYYAAVERYGSRSTLRLLLFGGPEDTHLAYEGVSKPFLDGEITGDRRHDRRANPLTYPNEIDHFFQPHYQIQHSLQLGDRLNLDTTLFYFEGDGYFEQYKSDRWMPEYGLEPFPGPDGNLIESTDLVRRREVDEWDFGWIPTLTWTHAGGGARLQAGVAVRRHHGHHFGATGWAQYYPPDLAPNHRYYDYELAKTSLQAFVQETWQVSEQWSLMAGGTWTSHDFDMGHDRRNGVEIEESFRFFHPRLGVLLRPAEQWSVYANVSRGGREPAFRDIYDPQDYWSQQLQLEEERLTDFELGSQWSFPDGYARVNLYWMDFDNAIVWAGGLDNNGLPVTANGAVTDQRGAELELSFSPLPRTGGRLSVSWADHRFDEFTEYDFEGNSYDHSGNAIAGSPEWLASLDLSAGWGPLDLLLSLRHVGRFYLDNTEDLRKYPEIRNQPGYVHRVNDPRTTVDLGLKAHLGTAVETLCGATSATLDLRVTNVGDELYTTFGYFDGSEPVWIPAATRSVYAGLTIDW